MHTARVALLTRATLDAGWGGNGRRSRLARRKLGTAPTNGGAAIPARVGGDRAGTEHRRPDRGPPCCLSCGRTGLVWVSSTAAFHRPPHSSSGCSSPVSHSRGAWLNATPHGSHAECDVCVAVDDTAGAAAGMDSTTASSKESPAADVACTQPLSAHAVECISATDSEGEPA